MNRRFIALASLAIWAQCSAVFAQIAGPETAATNTVVALKIDRVFPAGSKAKYRWSVPAGLSIGEGSEDNKIAYVTGPAATYTPTATVAWLDGDALKLEAFSHTLTIGEAPPVPPTPVVTLADLAGADAVPLAAFYADFRSVVPLLTTTETIRTTHARGLDLKGLAGNGAKDEIAARFDAALGAGSTTLTDELRSSIDAMLASIVAELGSKPTPPVPPGPTPPVVEGKRRVVILHETSDNTPELSQLFVKLRRQDVEQYLQSKGHRLDILDDDQVTHEGTPDPLVVRLNGLGQALPALFILDLTSGEVIHKQALPATPEAVMEVLKTHGG